ncbi:MAG: hypothetical protein ACLUQ6_11970 [Alistipes onderdonkii]
MKSSTYFTTRSSLSTTLPEGTSTCRCSFSRHAPSTRRRCPADKRYPQKSLLKRITPTASTRPIMIWSIDIEQASELFTR